MHGEPYASATTGLRSWQSPQNANFLKQPEQFEDDYDDNNYSNYVEDVSVHAVTDIRLGLRWRALMQADHRRWNWKTAGVASRRSFIQGTITKRLGCPLAKLIVCRLLGRRALGYHLPVGRLLVR